MSKSSFFWIFIGDLCEFMSNLHWHARGDPSTFLFYICTVSQSFALFRLTVPHNRAKMHSNFLRGSVKHMQRRTFEFAFTYYYYFFSTDCGLR